VFRSEQPDYGIDGSVELFAPDGSPTGLRFWVQIKATQKPSRRPSVRLRVETGRYYKILDLPVLIVLWELEDDRLFAQWFHQFDPFYGRLGTKTLMIPFRAEHEWDEHRPGILEQDLQIRRRYTKGCIPLPIPVEIRIFSPSVGTLSAPRALHSIRAYLRKCGAIFNEQSTDGALWIHAESEKLVVSFRGAPSVTIHYSTASTFDNTLGADVVILAAVAISRVGDHNLASTLANMVADDSAILTAPEMLLIIGHSLLASRRFGLAFEMADKMLKNPDNRFATDPLLVLGLMPGLSDRDHEAVERHLRRKIDSYDRETDARELAIAIYNLGNQLRQAGRDREALRLYRRAGDIHPPYLQRDYYWKEIAGLLFGARRYRLSAALYGKAIALGGRPSWRALYADALMYAGRFAAAGDAFDSYLDAEEKSDYEWVLKRLVVSMLSERYGDEVRRETARAATLLELDSNPAVAGDALRLDPLDVNGWLRLAVQLQHRSAVDECATALVTAAVLARNSADLWLQAFLSVVRIPELGHLVKPVAFAAFGAIGEQWNDSIDTFVAHEEMSDEATTALYQVILDLRAEYNATFSPAPLEMRIAGEGAEYSSIFVQPDGPATLHRTTEPIARAGRFRGASITDNAATPAGLDEQT
jgi:tetratricopeptide (TPR) repeat protein